MPPGQCVEELFFSPIYLDLSKINQIQLLLMVCEEVKRFGFSGSQMTHPPELGLWAKQPSALGPWYINHRAETAGHAGC